MEALGWEAWFTLAVVLGTVVLLALERLPPSFVVFGAMVTLLVFGVIDVEAAFAGFSNPAPITVAALFVLARAVETTGALEPVVNRILGRSESPGDRALLLRIITPVAFSSGALNNTPIVAMVAPQLVDWCRQRGQSASRLLMPLSFAAIMGGLLTAIGTSTNLVVSGLLVERGHEPIALFEITRIGLPVVLVGGLVLIVTTPWLLPDRGKGSAQFGEGIREFTVAMRVVPGGPLEGKTVQAAGLRALDAVFLVKIERNGEVITPVSPDQLLHDGDVLVFAGQVGLVVDLQRKRGLESVATSQVDRLDGPQHTFFEAVIGPDSPLVGQTLKDYGFRAIYNAAVLAIHRAGDRLDAKLGEVPLRVGDTLLLLADDRFDRRWYESGHFLLIARRGGPPPSRRQKAPVVAGIAGALLLGAGTGLVPILQGALVAAALLVLANALTPREARDAVDINVLVLIASAFGVGAAIEITGLAAALGNALATLAGPAGVIGGLLAVFLATLLLTELITNNAAAVLMFPVAMAAASTAGVDPRGYAITVAVAASASFLTPIGYQTNTMVYGLGGYRFFDYARVGFPLTVAVLVTTVALVPVFWPL